MDEAVPDYVKWVDYMGICITADFEFCGEVAVATALVSRRYPSGGIHLLMCVQQPLNARSIHEAVERLEDFYLGPWLGSATAFQEPSDIYQVETPLSSGARFAHALIHLQAHLEMDTERPIANRIEVTARDYRFLMEMNVAKPAVLLAELYGIQPKTVQHRFHLMREQGLVPSYGHGRKTKPRS